MKFKKIIAFAAAGVLALSAVGCGKDEKASETAVSTVTKVEVNDEGTALLEKALEVNSDIESFVSLNTLEFAFDNGSGKQEATVKTTVTEIQTSPVQKGYVTETIGNGQALVSSGVYVKETDGQKELFIGQDNQWYKSDVDDETLFYTVGIYDMKDIGRIFLEAVDGLEYVGKEEVNGMTLSKANGIVSSENVPDMVLDTGIFVTAGMTSLTYDHMIDVPAMSISFWFDEATGHVHKIAFDAAPIYQKIADNMFELVKDVEGYENAAALEIDKYALTYEISDINAVEKVDFPADLDDAVDLDALAAETGAAQ